ncbi:ZIP family metal transporter [Maritimibacter sp. 55A14]|uniref:ZIP family metal transporter n=1 Tax=Maritimibacter sp. 55A14 TaxID=2174844 RepID=UPI001E47275E|nr:divalent cation transporter [Maritimibacter sp. 55A14]
MLLSLLAGAAIPAGAALAMREDIQSDWLEAEFRHGVIAFGGGILLAAVAFVLVPDGTAKLPVWAAMAALGLGGVGFALLDRLIETRLGQMAQLVAMLADFLPEALALGALFASGSSSAPLLALMIGLQNLPEGFNSCRELSAAGLMKAPARVLLLFAGFAFLGPLAALGGHLWLVDYPQALGALMLFAAGGILYLIF